MHLRCGLTRQDKPFVARIASFPLWVAILPILCPCVHCKPIFHIFTSTNTSKWTDLKCVAFVHFPNCKHWSILIFWWLPSMNAFDVCVISNVWLIPKMHAIPEFICLSCVVHSILLNDKSHALWTRCEKTCQGWNVRLSRLASCPPYVSQFLTLVRWTEINICFLKWVGFTVFLLRNPSLAAHTKESTVQVRKKKEKWKNMFSTIKHGMSEMMCSKRLVFDIEENLLWRETRSLMGSNPSRAGPLRS